MVVVGVVLGRCPCALPAGMSPCGYNVAFRHGKDWRSGIFGSFMLYMDGVLAFIFVIFHHSNQHQNKTDDLNS